MASFEERKREIATSYAAAAATQNLKQLRETMLEHQELILEDDGNADELVEALSAAGWRVMGKPVTAATVVELVDLVSDVREGMTGSQRLTVFMQELLGSKKRGGAGQHDRPRPPRASPAAPARRSAFQGFYGSRDRQRAEEREYPGLDLDGQGFGDGAVRGIAIGVAVATSIGAVLYLISLIA